MTITQEAQREASISLADPALLDKIDQLFACNVGEYIDLPQLVVIGDQSSGKSSILEGLTKLKFPRNSGLCTRFATQILFRRDPSLSKRQVTGSIIKASHDGNNACWSVTGIESLSASEFENMMSEVHIAMGLSTSMGDGQPTFSADILRVIDVPGIFKTTTPGLTSKSDIKLVRDMVLGYMRNPRSIMLAVVPANVDIATQEIIEMTRELDPDSMRTLRILTKPDLVDKGAEEAIIQLVEGKQESEELGWVVVRNLGQKDLQDPLKDRDAEEETFRKAAPWNQLSDDNHGIVALAKRLQGLLASNVRRVFPNVRSEVSKRLKECKKSLDRLGDERESPEQQSKYLLAIVAKFQRITENALHTNYGSQDAFDNERDLRLATLVANRNAQLAEDFESRGHVYTFKSHSHDDDLENRQDPPTSPTGTVANGMNNEEKEEEKEEEQEICHSVPSRKISICHDIEDVLRESQPIHGALTQGILPWIEDIYEASRGFELGTFNASILASVLKRQSSKWPNLAEGYICDVICMVHIFTRKALNVACGDPRRGEIILSLLMDDLLEKYRRALRMTEFLLRIEREGTPMTQNHYLNSNLQKCRQSRIISEVGESSFFVKNEHGSREKSVRLSDLARIHDMSNLQHTVKDIHDILKSYYKVARKRFIDNLCMQAADYHLVIGLVAPMTLFSPSWVYQLSREQLEQIAGEEISVRKKRQRLQRQVKELEMGRKIIV
ncbi:hypothetical protein N7478_000716 [Penicillium angulare]|uniref:uncharacterized protein n=1 Tax=Penicillium angulare TaxID=116970 RepID=UPI0025407A12|nr:uncharacterized protein N7478_000716 [Penicillium angulare]KAJ5291465.1 hypothetical protein N7478_000716 [Penicillium angulare]